MFAILRKELRSLFVSPLAWTLLGVMQFILAWLFLQQLEAFDKIQPRLVAMENAPGVTDLVVTPLFAAAGALLLFVVPVLAMRGFSSEFRSGSIQLLLAAPISKPALVLGKFFALLGFLCISLLLTTLMPLSLLFGTQLDMGKLLAGLLALFCLSAFISALGLFFSSLTEHPAVAAISSYGVILFLWMLGNSGHSELPSALAQAGFSPHFDALLSGLIDSYDVIYFVVLSLLALLLCSQRLHDRYHSQ
ncbi:MAG: ABC transporter permease [gamma proteobacterium symbiont of Bathyaustriella thionipta]|nr:ABC transporter permease [gamma proteobacterium symbiont of Bathyaustriella thionipta]